MLGLMVLVYFGMAATPERLVLVNGEIIPLTDGLQFEGRTLRFRQVDGGFYVLPLRVVDLARTFTVDRPEPAEPVAVDQIQRQVPWEHPHFRDKTTSLIRVEITTDKVQAFAQGKMDALPSEYIYVRSVETGGRKQE